MPYECTSSPDGSTVTFRLRPHRSLPRRGFAAFVLGTFTLFTIPLFGLLGTALLWGMLPFLLIAVGALWWGLERSYRDGRIVEELTLKPDMARLIRQNPAGEQQEWECNSYWVQVTMHESDGPVPHYVTLRGGGREVEIGAFLSEKERKALHDDLARALARLPPA